MRLLNVIAGLTLFSSVFAAEVIVDNLNANEEFNSESVKGGDVTVQASFPETNVFQHVVNGEKNPMSILVENKSNLNVKVLAVGGAMYNPETGAFLRNLTQAKLNFPIAKGISFSVPYTFHSEFKTGELRLNVWLEHTLGEEIVHANAYDAVVTIVEPPISILDFKMITTYLMVLAILSGTGYLAYLTFVPQPKPSRRTTKQEISAPEGTVTASGTGGYQEEWIPEHHMKKRVGAGKRTKSQGGLTSGDESASASEFNVAARKGKGKQ
ncbi:hypothetical protein BDV98DRAFT_602592 [Pterulicium gracile]|uniref:Translocon-associated protein subunit alpha n=1 Tax=Pterulicium gracile TaxID=1884261 RepID=A0A5C3QTF3_9AGAR|nr:hypothetical protein BDV98DRAFT_602592 [Pterula gracilis]